MFQNQIQIQRPAILNIQYREAYVKATDRLRGARQAIKYLSWALILVGIFFVMDALFLHTISFDYSNLGLGWLDPYFSHLYIGIALVAVGAWGQSKG
ncbi:MAG: hypothetical protein H3Z49_05905 [archaeon]|nr:hypothetical protein [archaeon]